MNAKIKIADLSDLEEIARLFDQYRIFYSMRSNLADCKSFVSERLSTKGSIIFLISMNGKAAGFAQIYPSFSSVAMRPIWVLNDLFVSKVFRKQGCAKLLMRQVETEAASRDIYSIKLSTAVDNYTAKHLYHSIGYSKITEFDHYSLTPRD